MAAAQAMYGRLRIVDVQRYKPWDELSIDATDHYCIAAHKAIRSFYESATCDVLAQEPS